MISLKSVSRSGLAFVFLATGLLLIPIIGILFLTPPNSQEEPVFRSEKSQILKNRFGHPDKFAEHFDAVQGLNDGYATYAHGHKMREFQKALQKNAKRGVKSTTLNWIERGPGNVGGRSRAIVVDPADPTLNTWFVATVGGGVWKGQRFINQNGLEQVEWTPLTDDLPSLAATTLDISQSNPDIMYVGTGEGFYNLDGSNGVGMFKTTDKGNTWTHLSSTAYDRNWRFINRLAVHPDNPDIVVAVTHSGIFRTEDGGASFEKVFNAPSNFAPVLDLKVNPDNFDVQFAAVSATSIIRSLDGGRTWESVLGNFVYGAARIELAISPSHPEVIWASIEGTGARAERDFFGDPLPISDLYRSIDNGETWKLIEFTDETPSGAKTFLDDQGWYDNAIAVHPFSPDTVYVAGVNRWKAWVNDDGEFESSTVTAFNNRTSFLALFNFVGSFASGTLDAGFLRANPDDDVQDIEVSDMTSVEIRFGPGLTQKAHRFTVPANGGPAGNGGAGIPFTQYQYADYIEVPFQVWDVENNRQLMVSFRDQARDGDWTLIPSNTEGPGATHSREYLFISKYDYDDANPHPEFTEVGGLRKGLMYFFWPYLFLSGDGSWDPNNPSSGLLEIKFATVGGRYRDTESWENGEVHVDHHGFEIIPIDQSKNEFHVLNVNDGGVAYSRDSGENWLQGDETSPGFNTSQFYDATKRPGFSMYIGGTQDNGTYASYNNPDNQRGWRDMLGGDGFDVIWKGSDSLMGSIQYNNIYRSLNAGTRWELAGNIGDFEGQFLTSLGWTPESGEVVFSISPEDGLLRSMDFGESWQKIPPVSFASWGGVGQGRVRVSLADPSVVWAGYYLRRESSPATLHVSENALNASQDVIGGGDPARIRPVNSPSFAPAAVIAGLATHPFTRATAYVTFAVACQPKILRTEDLGQTWEDLSGFVGSTDCESSNGFPDAQVWDLEVFPSIPWVIWAGTDIGIFESRDHGKTWSYADNGLPAVSVWRIRIVDDEVVLATHGRGVWTLDLNEVQTNIELEEGELPSSFELLDNYPNPFNPTTSIRFKTATESRIRLTVFDMLGREIATLTDQQYPVGTHQIQWNASEMGSGQYIYRMEANGKVIGAKTMVLIK